MMIAVAIYSFAALAANPSAVPRIISTANASTDNVTSAFATSQLFGYANMLTGVRRLPSLRSATNSTFKWYKRTQYQPQNRSLVGYWKLDGNAMGGAL